MENQVNVGDQSTQQIGQNQMSQPVNISETRGVNYWVIGGIIFVCLIIFGFGGYFLGKQSSIPNNLTSKQQSIQTNPTVTTVPSLSTDNCVVEKDSILSVVTNFETLQKNKDPKGVLALFIAPQLQDEISDYQNLSGKNANVEPRLYNNVSTNFNTQSYKVTQQPTKSSNSSSYSCVVQVEEQRSNYGGPTNPKYLPAQAESFALTLRKQNGEWKIDQYMSLDPKIKTGKYSGFLMEYLNPVKGTIQYLPTPGNPNTYEYNLVNTEQGFPVSDMSGQGNKVTRVPLIIKSEQIKAQVVKDVGKSVTVYGIFSYYSETPVLEVIQIVE